MWSARRRMGFTAAVAAFLACAASPSHAQIRADGGGPPPRVEIVKRAPDALRGDVVLSVGGIRKTVGGDAWKAWVVEGGSAVVFAKTGGAGGFEGEGQTLWRYDRATGRTALLMSDAFLVEGVEDARAASGRRALLVRMRDGGAGNSASAVLDPKRGQVWRRTNAAFAANAARNGRVTVRVFRPGEGAEENRIERTINLDLDRFLRRAARADGPVDNP